MLFAALKKIDIQGKIDIQNYKGKLYSFGKGVPYSKISLTKSIEKKILLNPGLYLGEGYMNGEIKIEEGSFEDFIKIITSGYDDFLSNNLT